MHMLLRLRPHEPTRNLVFAQRYQGCTLPMCMQSPIVDKVFRNPNHILIPVPNMDL